MTKTDTRRHRNGIAPNFIHSLDSCHLFKTVNASRKQGIRAFQVIHDSYGTHACDVEDLARIVKDEFVRIYTDDILGDLIAEVQAQLPPGVELPERPPTGEFDITKVREADFFFS
jgi:DNA-directed RNA polymerase